MSILKLGKDTGSVFNHIYSQIDSKPVVGEPATILWWTDREAYMVTDILRKDKEGNPIEISIDRINAKITKGDYYNPIEYDYSELRGRPEKLVFYRGNWCYLKEWVGYVSNEVAMATTFNEDNYVKDEHGKLADPLELKVIPNLSKKYRKYEKVRIVFGIANEYRDPTF